MLFCCIHSDSKAGEDLWCPEGAPPPLAQFPGGTGHISYITMTQGDFVVCLDRGHNQGGQTSWRWVRWRLTTGSMLKQIPHMKGPGLNSRHWTTHPSSTHLSFIYSSIHSAPPSIHPPSFLLPSLLPSLLLTDISIHPPLIYSTQLEKGGICAS